jgi:hypothetical protein
MLMKGIIFIDRKYSKIKPKLPKHSDILIHNSD